MQFGFIINSINLLFGSVLSSPSLFLHISKIEISSVLQCIEFLENMSMKISFEMLSNSYQKSKFLFFRNQNDDECNTFGVSLS